MKTKASIVLIAVIVLAQACVATRTPLQENKITSYQLGKSWYSLKAEYDRLYTAEDSTYENKLFLATKVAPVLNKLKRAEIVYLDAVLAWSKAAPADSMQSPAPPSPDVIAASAEVDRLVADINLLIATFSNEKEKGK